MAKHAIDLIGREGPQRTMTEGRREHQFPGGLRNLRSDVYSSGFGYAFAYGIHVKRCR